MDSGYEEHYSQVRAVLFSWEMLCVDSITNGLNPMMTILNLSKSHINEF